MFFMMSHFAKPAVRRMGTLTARTALLSLALALPAMAAGRLPKGFVYLREVAPGIAQDMRYAGTDNFTGQPLPGYDAAECVLRRDVAAALARVAADLARDNLGLKVYDCYRPVRAVEAFARWAREPDDGATKRFFPALEKSRLFADGYIASHSAHSTGNAVDLTLVELPAAPAPLFDPHAAYGPCTGPAAERAPDNSIDMGTGFDCFDERSHTASAAVTLAQQRWRAKLTAAMRARGFHNYPLEWWHFSYGTRGKAYDFPIALRR
jgi:zinc D-Ala-D-Ala dipeptidase